MGVVFIELVHALLFSSQKDPRKILRKEYYQQSYQNQYRQARKRVFKQVVHCLVVEQKRQAEAE